MSPRAKVPRRPPLLDPDTGELRPVELNARRFALAWLNVCEASSSLPEHPMLDETVMIEVYDPTTVRLVATDTVLLLYSTVYSDPPNGGAPNLPKLGDNPKARWLVSDASKRIGNLCGYLRKVTKKDPDRTITFTLRTAEREDTPTLDPSLDRMDLQIEADIEAVRGPLLDEQTYPNWRGLIDDAERAPLAELAINPAYLARLGRLRAPAGDHLRIATTEAVGHLTIHLEADPPVDGFLAYRPEETS